MNDGAWTRDGHEQHERRGQRLSSAAPSTKSASQPSTPGILVFSHRRQLLHMNRRALAMVSHLDQAETGPATMTLSRLVSELRVQIQDALDSRRETDIREHFELKRVMVEAGRTVLLRGVGLPNQNSSDHSRVIIILEEVSLQQERGASQAQAKVQSPDREGAAAWEGA
jgi:nitrogen fixation/metabolism regulation signal transduction histidine kinase